MSDHNPKPMNKEELEKYIEKDFLPSLLSKFPNIPDLEAENARLKADAQLVVKHLGEACADNLRLKADVVELADALKLASEVGIKVADEVTRLKAEVERLRKAGDALRSSIISGTSSEEWQAIEEGRPQVSEDRTPYGQHDATVALRLELGRMTDKANALEGALRKEVMDVVGEEIQKQLKACGEEFVRQVKSPSFIEDLGNGVEKHDLLFRYPAKEGKPSV